MHFQITTRSIFSLDSNWRGKWYKVPLIIIYERKDMHYYWVWCSSKDIRLELHNKYVETFQTKKVFNFGFLYHWKMKEGI